MTKEELVKTLEEVQSKLVKSKELKAVAKAIKIIKKSNQENVMKHEMVKTGKTGTWAYRGYEIVHIGTKEYWLYLASKSIRPQKRSFTKKSEAKNYIDQLLGE